MKLANVEKKEANQIELSIIVEKDEFEDACEQSYRKNVKGINIQGFRKGKAPRKMIEKMYGAEIFYEDAMNFSYPDAYDSAVEQAGIEPIDRPKLTDFDVTEAGEFHFKAVVEVKPDVVLGAYKGLEAEKAEPAVTAADVDAEVERLRDRNSRLVAVERAVENGDTVSLDFEGFVDGVAFEGGKGDNFSLKIGSGMFIPGFEEQLVGKTAGEECDVNVTFPEDYQAKELAGKATVFKCRVNEVKTTEKPELDDEFAKDVSEFDTFADFRADIENKLLENRKASANADFEEALMDKLIEGFATELPRVMIEKQLDRVVDDFNYRLSMQGMNLETYLQMNQMDMSSFRRLFEEQATRQVKIRLSLEKIAELENLTVSDEELDAEVKKLAEDNKLTEERVKELLSMVSLRRDLAVQKSVALIRETAVATAVKEEKPAKAKKAAKKDDEKAEKPAKAAKKPADESDAEAKPARKKATKKPAEGDAE